MATDGREVKKRGTAFIIARRVVTMVSVSGMCVCVGVSMRWSRVL